MTLPNNFKSKIRQAWQGRISGCMLGKAVETFSMREGHAALHRYLDAVDALPLRDYIPFDPEHASPHLFTPCCRDKLDHGLADDDINYSVLALMLLEEHGTELTTTDVARAWLKWLPVASTFTAERAAYKILLERGHEWFPEGHLLGFEITECADNPYNDWIGAQIRADVYGWVCPGKPELAAHLAGQDAALSHRGEGIHGAVFVAVLGSSLAGGDTIEKALERALGFIPEDSDCADVVRRAHLLRDNPDGGNVLREQFPNMSVVHTVNNLGLVVWALTRYPDDFDAAIGDVVAAGLDTDCNGATVGALWALQGKPIPAHWTTPWQNKVGVSLAGMTLLDLDSLVDRTVKVTQSLTG